MPTSTCPNGHPFRKTRTCPVCPLCEQARKPRAGFLATLAAPARRALEREGITTPEKLAAFTEEELLQLHGLGPGSLPKLRAMLAASGLSFRS